MGKSVNVYMSEIKIRNKDSSTHLPIYSLSDLSSLYAFRKTLVSKNAKNADIRIL